MFSGLISEKIVKLRMINLIKVFVKRSLTIYNYFWYTIPGVLNLSSL